MSHCVTTLACSAVIAFTAGCSDTAPAGTDGPTMADVAGSYAATTFTSQDSTGLTDWLQQGASVTLMLTASGATTGHLFVPGGAENGADLDADMAGTWALHADTVRFSQTADTFVRDMPFVFGNNQLSGQDTYSGTVVRLVLTKQ